MDADSLTGLNDNSESGECDSPSQDENTNNTIDFDSTSKLSANSDRTNIDALDDAARDTLIVPPGEDSSNSTKSQKRDVARVDPRCDHDELDFEGDDLEENPRVTENRPKNDVSRPDDDEDEEGELEDEKPEESSSPQHGLEEGECVDERAAAKTQRKKIVYKESEKDEGEEDELEEGEVTDDEDRNNKMPKPVCRFFGKGQCTWGSNCRFLHPGVTDKGLYTMFDPMRPLLPIPNNPASSIVKPGLLGVAPPNFPPIIKPEEPIVESAWERGLRTAKEIIKQSVKRKETDIDFEEKKMNLTLAQEEIDKENDYYVRKPASPEPTPEVVEDDAYLDTYDLPGPWAGPAAAGAPPGPRHTVAPQKIDPDFVRERVHRLHKPGRGIREAPPRDAPVREAPPLHEPEVRMVRESALRRGHGFQDQYTSHGSRRNYVDPRKAEEWHDPWMRSKSPGGRTARKDSTVSKRSSYSSGSSRSSSRSSSSSKSSRSSRSSSRSSRSSRGSKSPATKRRRKSREEPVRKAPPRRMSPKPVRIAPPPPPKEEFGRRGPGGYGGPPHYDRPPRFAPSPPKGPPILKDRIPDKNPPLVRERDLKGNRGGGRGRRRSSWSNRSDSSSRSRSRSRSRSVSRSRSRSPWSKSLSKSHSKSRSRSVSSKPRTRSKFSRDRSVSGSPSPSRSRSLSRRLSSSRSRSPSSSSSSSSSLGSPTLARTRRKAPSVEKVIPPSDSMSSTGHMPPKQLTRKPDAGRQPPAPAKTQIKMTLKANTGLKANKNVLDRLSDDIKDERSQTSRDGNRTPIPDEDSSREALSIEDVSNGNKGVSPKETKSSSKRREELLKQLKAVEDAIAKKRSKLEKI